MINDNDFDLDKVKHGSLENFARWVESLPPCKSPAEHIEAGRVDFADRDALLQKILQSGEKLAQMGKAAAADAAIKTTEAGEESAS